MSRYRSSFRRITLLHESAQGEVTATTLARKKRRKRRNQGALGAVERLVDRAIRADEVFIRELARRHRRSRRKQQLAWLYESGSHVAKAGRRAVRDFTR